MLYTLTRELFPTYYRPSYRGTYVALHRAESALSPDPITALHYHDLMELGVCLSGRGSNYIDERKYDYAAGDIQVVPAGVPHLSRSAETEKTRWCWLSLDPLRILRDAGMETTEALRALVRESYCGVFHPWEYPRLADLITQLVELPVEQGGDLTCAFLVGQLLTECARIGGQDRQRQPPKRLSSRVSPALDAIRDRFADNEAMAQVRLAGLCGMSTSHFRAVFKQETGIGVRKYIIQTRLVAAAHRLKTTDDSVLGIAMEVGFGQVSCFNHSFRAAFGQTPTQFRKQIRLLR